MAIAGCSAWRGSAEARALGQGHTERVVKGRARETLGEKQGKGTLKERLWAKKHGRDAHAGARKVRQVRHGREGGKQRQERVRAVRARQSEQDKASKTR